jgi:tRNA threonylcarbamoyladenosine biosynthesis protein TsaB
VKLLAIDTATASCSAALLMGERLLQREQLLERGHAEAILPMVDELLTEAGVALTELTAIAFGRGPGAFTGVRLAASVTQGLAFGAGIPVVPVSDLQAIAQRALDLDGAVERVLVCTDARMREVYWGCFERSPDGLARAVDGEHVSPPAAVRDPPAWAERRPIAGAGSGFAAYPELRAGLGLDVVFGELLPRSAEIARLAVPEVAAGRFLEAEQALPVYLRDDVAHRAPEASRN